MFQASTSACLQELAQHKRLHTCSEQQFGSELAAPSMGVAEGKGFQSPENPSCRPFSPKTIPGLDAKRQLPPCSPAQAGRGSVRGALGSCAGTRGDGDPPTKG